MGQPVRRLVDLYVPPSRLEPCERDSRAYAAASCRGFSSVFAYPCVRQDKPGDPFRGWLRTIYRTNLNYHFRARQITGGRGRKPNLHPHADDRGRPTNRRQEVA